MKRGSIAGSPVRVLRWRVVKQISQFANYEHRYADNTHLALPPAAVGRTAVERRAARRDASPHRTAVERRPYQADFAKCGGVRRKVVAPPGWRRSIAVQIHGAALPGRLGGTPRPTGEAALLPLQTMA